MAPEAVEIRSKELQTLFDYWQSKRGMRLAPTRADILPTEIKPLLQRIMMVDVAGTPPRFKFRLAGTMIVDRFGEEITGRFLDELDLDRRNREIDLDYRKVVETAAPLCSRWRYTKNDGKFLNYERLLLPLSTDGKAIDMILGGAAEESIDSPAD
jgi:hypothetical protein